MTIAESSRKESLQFPLQPKVLQPKGKEDSERYGDEGCEKFNFDAYIERSLLYL